MHPKVLEKLGQLTENNDGHLICKRYQIKYKAQHYSATRVRFFQKHGRMVHDGVPLVKTCKVKSCVEHWIELPPKKTRKRKRPDTNDAKDEEEDGETGDLNINDFPEEYRRWLLKRIDANCISGKPKINIQCECRLWKGNERDGYGRFSIKSKTHTVSRAVYQLHYMADIPNGHHVRHLCGNSLCTTKEHLKTGTQVENERDKVATGTRLAGDTHPLCKHSNETVRRIFESELSNEECALQFGCTAAYARKIRNGNERNDVTGLPPPPKRPKRVKKELVPEDEKEAKAYILRNCTEVADDDGKKHWLWDLSKETSGHGRAIFHNIEYPAHTLAYRAWHQCAPIDSTMHVMRHKCKYPNCVNPDHLEPGTYTQNMADKVRDGTDARGEKNWNALLKDSFVRHLKCIREVTTQKERAELFDVPINAIQRIDRHKTYCHIDTDDEEDDFNDSYDEWKLDSDA